jgi:hypothetical protein
VTINQRRLGNRRFRQIEGEKGGNHTKVSHMEKNIYQINKYVYFTNQKYVRNALPFLPNKSAALAGNDHAHLDARLLLSIANSPAQLELSSKRHCC